MSENIRVLIADDEPGMRLILRRIIERAEGYELVGEAEDGLKLMELFDSLHPQVVFLDVDMPGLSGVACANRIQDADPACVLIFATAHEQYRADAFEVYAFDYLVKPFKVERVLQTLSNLRERRLNPPAPVTVPTPSAAPRPTLGRMMLHTGEGIRIINMEDILLVQR